MESNSCLGRVDDVINKAGHRLGTAEIESGECPTCQKSFDADKTLSALVAHPSCAEAAVIAIPHEIKG
jgi:acetyl-CoA synthetase